MKEYHSPKPRWKRWLPVVAMLSVPATLLAVDFLEVGSGNTITPDMIVAVGYSNAVNNSGGVSASMLIGTSNSMGAGFGNLYLGTGNFSFSTVNNSLAVGVGNYLAASECAALGRSLQSFSDGGVVVGKFNDASEFPNHDTVFVVGAGALGYRKNAFVVKDDGTVLIPQPQGDVSMGIYD